MSNEALAIEEVQRLEFEMLIFLDAVCSEAGIEYCLAYGSALGAYRHSGFIPWDDDMDVYIKRIDCNRLFDLLDEKGNGRYRVFRPCETAGYNHPYAKLVDCYTEIEEPKNNPVKNMGVFIDLFPCDFYNSAGPLLKTRISIVNILNKIYCQTYVRDHRRSSRVVCFFWKLVSKSASSKRVHSAIEGIAQRKSVPQGDYTSCPYDADYLIPAAWIFPTKIVVFEGRRCPVPGEIEQYLLEMYGSDYMIPHRTCDAYHGLARMRNTHEGKQDTIEQ